MGFPFEGQCDSRAVWSGGQHLVSRPLFNDLRERARVVADLVGSRNRTRKAHAYPRPSGSYGAIPWTIMLSTARSPVKADHQGYVSARRWVRQLVARAQARLAEPQPAHLSWLQVRGLLPGRTA
jgi:hypothetical protein